MAGFKQKNIINITMTMSEEKNKKTVSIYALADELLPRHQWCIGTDEVAEQLGNHPDWTFDTFIKHFMKDIVDRMIIRTKRNN